jgi:methyl-accepting chemotaxis protein
MQLFSKGPNNSGRKSAIEKVKKPAKIKKFKLHNPVKSVGMKLFLIIFSSIVIFVLTVGLISYSISKNVIKTKVSQSTQEAIVQTAAKLDLLLRSYDDLSRGILVNANLLESINAVTKSVDINNTFLPANEAEKYLQSVVFTNKTLNGIYLLPLKANLPTISSAVIKIDIDKLKQLPWFDATLKADGKTVWLDTKKTGLIKDSNSSFGLARLFKDPNTGKADYLLVMEINLNAINDELASSKVGDTGTIYIVNETNKIMQSKAQETLELPSDIHLPVDKASNQFQATGTETVTTHNGGDLMVAFQKIKNNGWTLVGSMPVKELVKEAAYIFNLTIIMAILAALIAVIIGYFVVRMIGRPLIQMRNLMDEGEKGNLSVRSNFHSQDEIGQLGQSFNKMMGHINQLVVQTNLSAQEVLTTASELSNASKTTATSAKEISYATEGIAAGAMSLAVEAERGSGLSSNIDDQMKVVLQANVQMTASAEAVKEFSEQGTHHMAELTEKTNITEEMTRSMVDKVNTLKDSTLSVRKILELLNNITKRTNILALNAAIEAARAGTAGKGFMVVADEVRLLAVQSRESIDVVAKITETIQKGIDETVTVLTTAYPVFKEQISSVKEVNSIFTSVQSHMGSFVIELDTVTKSVQKLDQTQSELSNAMGNVSAVAEESSATLEEVASLSNEQMNISNSLVHLSDKLESVSIHLKDVLAKFTV